MNDDQNGLSLEDEKISKISGALQKEGEQEFKGALANVGVEIMPQAAGDTDATESSAVENAPPEEETSPENTNSIIQSLRTYERDVANTIRAGETTMSINLAEQKRRLGQNQNGGGSTEQSASEKVARGSLLFIMSAILIVAALGTLGVTFYFKNKKTVPSTIVMRTIISIDDTKEVGVISLSPKNISEAVQKVLQENGGNGTLTEISLRKENILDAVLQSTEVTGKEFFETVAKGAPSALARALGENWLLGFYSLPKVDPFINEPFVIVEIDSFDNAYSAMLAWEIKMLADIGQIFKTNSPGTIAFSNTAPRDQFEDLIVKSRDTRVLRNTDGKILILYSFIDTDHLVIATHEKTFQEIVTRYLSRGLVR